MSFLEDDLVDEDQEQKKEALNKDEKI